MWRRTDVYVYWEAGGQRSSSIRAMSIEQARRLENAQSCAGSGGASPSR